MPVIFKCTCGRYLSVPNKYIGKKLQCLICHAIIPVPIPSQEIAQNSSGKGSGGDDAVTLENKEEDAGEID